MCRFVVYQGDPVRLDDLLFTPRHSLVAQSMRAESMSQPFNGDGFGVGWYPRDDADRVACVVRDTMPAWGSRNLRSLAANVASGLVFAHVRAASPGLAVQESNTHPFQNGPYLFMHNGDVAGFRTIKRRLQQSLSDPAWHAIEGTTDSEHAFAVLLDRLESPAGATGGTRMHDALVATLATLVHLADECGADPRMTCNLAVTDGATTVVCRWAHGGARPGTLYYSRGRRYAHVDGDGDMVEADGPATGAVIVASEPVTRRADDWHVVPDGHTLTVEADLSVTLRSIDLAA